jgi:hypothetical protein
VEKLNKDGRLSEGFFATYREVIKKPWIREREFFMGEQNKIKKELAKLHENKA